jgi:hypothetical protein
MEVINPIETNIITSVITEAEDNNKKPVKKRTKKTVVEIELTNEEKKDEKKPVKKRTKKTVVEPTQKDIVLFDYQVVHANILLNYLSRNFYAIDLSMLGSGKTYTTSYIYQTLLKDNKIKHIIIISPKSVQTKWMEIEQEYGIKIYQNTSFRSLIGVKFKQPKHGLLKRRDYMKQIIQDNNQTRDMEKCDYTCTTEYLNLIKEGVLLVIDEIQNIKNVNNQSDACKTLIKAIDDDFNNGGNSRLLLLSGSPIDKEYQVVTLFKSLNIMKEDRLSVMNPQTYEKMWRGMQEIEDYCLKFKSRDEIMHIRYGRLNRTSTPYNLRPYNYLEHNHFYVNEENYCYKLFQNVIKPNLSNAMSCKLDKYKIHKLNSFYRMTNETDLALLKKGIELLKKSTGFNNNTNTIHFGNNGAEALIGIQRALTMIETSKINLFARIIREVLDNYPNHKVVMGVNYTATINDLMVLLSDYNPLMMNGSISMKNRLQIINNFQQDNNNYRLLIANSSVICCGIDLNDKFGTHERVCFVSPNYKTIELYQLSHRFQRIDTKSNSLLNLTFVKDNAENRILNSLTRKGQIMKEVTEKQAEEGIIFPCDFETYYEPDEVI